MTEQHCIGARSVQRPVGLVRDLKGGEIDAGIKPERLVGAKTHDQRMRRVRLAGAVGRLKRGTDLGHGHIGNVTQRFAKGLRPTG